MSQRKMPLMGTAYEPKQKQVPHSQIEACEDEMDAIRLCRNHSHYRKDYMIAELIGMSATKFSRCMSGTYGFPAEKVEILEEVCGNMAPTQYRCWKKNIPLPETEKDRELREAEEQRAEADRRIQELTNAA